MLTNLWNQVLKEVKYYLKSNLFQLIKKNFKPINLQIILLPISFGTNSMLKAVKTRASTSQQ